MFKKIVCILFLFGTCFAIENDLLTDEDISVILANVHSTHRMQLPCPIEPIKYKPKKQSPYDEFFMGSINLFGGIGWGVLDFIQNGSVVRYENDTTRYDIPIVHKNLTYEYEYEMDLKLLNNEGIVWGYMLDLEMILAVTYVDGFFKLDHVPEISDKTKKMVFFKDGGKLEDLIFNYLSSTFFSVCYDLLCSIYFKFYCETIVEQMNRQLKRIREDEINDIE